MPAPLNIVLVFADQMHRFALRCMGTLDILTPHLDRLAADGILFRAAYSNCPVCTAFRINLFTGLYSGQTKTWGNEHPIPPGVPTLASTLEQGGYRTSFVGKWHIGGNGNQPIPPHLRGGFRDFIGYQCYNGFLDHVCYYDEAGTEHRFDQHRTDVDGNLAIQRLETLARGPERFALVVGIQAPHYPVQPAPEYAALYAGKTIIRRPNCQEIDPYIRTWSPQSPWPPENCPDYQRYGHNLDEYLRLYDAMVTQIDATMGRLLAALERLGIADRTAVVFTADHGDMQGSHGLKNKCLPYEESAGIPCIVRVPGGRRGAVTDAPVSGIDFMPTCLAWAGLQPPANLPGQNLAPYCQEQSAAPDAPVFCEREDWQMVRRGPWKLVVEGDDWHPTMLFHLAEDPYELHNRLNDPACAAKLAALHAALADWRTRHQIP